LYLTQEYDIDIITGYSNNLKINISKSNFLKVSREKSNDLFVE